jgi:hypothetical protein
VLLQHGREKKSQSWCFCCYASLVQVLTFVVSSVVTTAAMAGPHVHYLKYRVADDDFGTAPAGRRGSIDLPDVEWRQVGWYIRCCRSRAGQHYLSVRSRVISSTTSTSHALASMVRRRMMHASITHSHGSCCPGFAKPVRTGPVPTPKPCL